MNPYSLIPKTVLINKDQMNILLSKIGSGGKRIKQGFLIGGAKSEIPSLIQVSKLPVCPSFRKVTAMSIQSMNRERVGNMRYRWNLEDLEWDYQYERGGLDLSKTSGALSALFERLCLFGLHMEIYMNLHG